MVAKHQDLAPILYEICTFDLAPKLVLTLYEICTFGLAAKSDTGDLPGDSRYEIRTVDMAPTYMKFALTR